MSDIDVNKIQQNVKELQDQNAIDFQQWKRLGKEIEKLSEKIKLSDTNLSVLMKKIKNDYEKMKKIIIDENIQVQLNNKIEKNKKDIIDSNNKIEKNINEINKKVNIVTYENKVDELSSQLDTKANEIEVVKKGYGDLNDFNEKTRALIQGLAEGETNINAVLGIENVKRENISAKALSIEKTDFFNAESPNMVYGIEERGYYDFITGLWTDRDDIFTTGLIKAEINNVIFTNAYSIYIYNKDGAFLHEAKNFTNNQYTIKSEGSNYIRANFKYEKTSISECYLKINSLSDKFYSESLKIFNHNLEVDVVDTKNMKDKSITIPKLGFVSDTKIGGSYNCISEYTIKEKGYFSTDTSLWTNRDDIFTTEEMIYIDEIMKEFIIETNAYTIYMYGENKEFLRQSSKYPKQIKLNSDVYYIRPNFKYETVSINDATLLLPYKKYVLNDIEITDKKTSKFMHISSDDMIDVFKDLANNSYSSIFENSILAFLKQMNMIYSLTFSGYCFYEDGSGFNLSQVPDTYAIEFKENSNWLKFGFHALNTSNYAEATYEKGKQDYELVITELYRICGGLDSIDRVPRVQNFAGSLECCKAWFETDKCSILGLLSAEDTRNSYYHSNSQRDFLQKHDRLIDYTNGITFFSTDLRLENVNNVTMELTSRLNDVSYSSCMNDLIIFTHETFLSQTTMQNKIIQCCQFAINNGYMFDFPMNRLI